MTSVSSVTSCKMVRVTFVCFVVLLLSGCTHLQLNHSDRLIARPDFTDAARAAPLWVDDALKTINRLEHDLERK